jgi:hypothetical protein
MRKLWLVIALALLPTLCCAQQWTPFRYYGTAVISASTFTSALIAPAKSGEQVIVTHWFAEPVSGTIISFWFSSSNTCTPVTASGITSMTITNNQPIMDGDGSAPIVAGPVGSALCAQAVTAAVPGLVTYGQAP